MDPNTCLKRIRELYESVQYDYENAEKGIDDSEADELASCIQALDAWICRGGFLPEAWKGNIK